MELFVSRLQLYMLKSKIILNGEVYCCASSNKFKIMRSILIISCVMSFNLMVAQDIYHGIYHITHPKRKKVIDTTSNIPIDVQIMSQQYKLPDLSMEVWHKNDTVISTDRLSYERTDELDFSLIDLTLIVPKKYILLGYNPRKQYFAKRIISESEKYVIDSIDINYNGNIVNSAINKEIPCRIWYKPANFPFGPFATFDFTGIVLKCALPNEIYILEKFEKIPSFNIPNLKGLKEVSMKDF